MEMNGNSVFILEPDEVRFEEHSDDDLAWLHLADNRSNPPRYAMLTVSHHDKQSYLELNDQASSSYDCLAEITFFNGGVVIQLRTDAVAAFQNISRLAVIFKRLPAEQIECVQQLLATAFAEAMQPIESFSTE